MRDLKEYNGRKNAIGKISEAGGQGVWKAREWFSSGRKVWQKVEPYVAQIGQLEKQGVGNGTGTGTGTGAGAGPERYRI